MNLRKAAEMALEALHNIDQSNNYDAIEALRQALAQPDNDAMKTMLAISIEVNNNLFDGMQTLFDYQKLCNREWVGLTDEDLKPLCSEWRIMYGGYVDDFAKAIEAKLKEKNT